MGEGITIPKHVRSNSEVNRLERVVCVMDTPGYQSYEGAPSERSEIKKLRCINTKLSEVKLKNEGNDENDE